MVSELGGLTWKGKDRMERSVRGRERERMDGKRKAEWMKGWDEMRMRGHDCTLKNEQKTKQASIIKI